MVWESISNLSGVSDLIGSSAQLALGSQVIIGATILIFLMAFLIVLRASLDLTLVVFLGGVFIVAGAGFFPQSFYDLIIIGVGLLMGFMLLRIFVRR